MKQHKRGQRLGHDDANRYEEVDDWFRRFKRLGEGGDIPSAPAQFAIVWAANYTSTQINIGDVCEFDGYPFAEIDTDGRHPDPRSDRWLKAVTPDATRVGWGVALDPMQGLTGEDRQGGQFLIVGCCHAKVVIEDDEHEYATRVDGERVLHSTAAKTSCKLLHVPAGDPDSTRVCLVELTGEPGDVVDFVKVNDMSALSDHLVYPDDNGVFSGRIMRFDGEVMDDKGDCWIVVVDDDGAGPGNVAMVNGKIYGTARYHGPVEFDSDERPLYVVSRGELATEIVEVNHEVDGGEPDAGDIVPANADGYHSGRIRRRNGNVFDGGQAIWIRFVNNFIIGGVAGAVFAVQGEFYGPARYAGVYDLVENEGEEDETHDERPVYVCECSEAIFLCKFDSAVAEGSTGTVSLYHSHDQTDSGENITSVLAWGSNWESGKKGVVQRIAGKWCGSQTEWTC